MLSEISQLQGDKPGTIPCEGFRVAEITDSTAVTGGRRQRGMRRCWLTGIERVLVSQEEKNSGDVCGVGGARRLRKHVDVPDTAALHAQNGLRWSTSHYVDFTTKKVGAR